MSLHRHSAKRDANEPLVVEALEKCGWTVRRLSASGWPDLLVHKRKGLDTAVHYVEVKQPKKKLRASQEWWSGVLPVAVLRSIDEVIEWNKSQ